MTPLRRSPFVGPCFSRSGRISAPADIRYTMICVRSYPSMGSIRSGFSMAGGQRARTRGDPPPGRHRCSDGARGSLDGRRGGLSNSGVASVGLRRKGPRVPFSWPRHCATKREPRYCIQWVCAGRSHGAGLAGSSAPLRESPSPVLRERTLHSQIVPHRTTHEGCCVPM